MAATRLTLRRSRSTSNLNDFGPDTDYKKLYADMKVEREKERKEKKAVQRQMAELQSKLDAMSLRSKKKLKQSWKKECLSVL